MNESVNYLVNTWPDRYFAAIFTHSVAKVAMMFMKLWQIEC